MDKNYDEVRIKSSYGVMFQKIEENKPEWMKFFYDHINEQCTKMADIATNKEYPKYSAGGEMTDTMTRTWYQAYMQEYQKQIETQKEAIKEMSLEDRAHIAFEARHHARVQTRSQMADKSSVEMIQSRDLKKYESKDGPTFDWLMRENKSKGMNDKQSHQAIIDSALTTNMWVNTYISAVKAYESVASYASSWMDSISQYVSDKVSIDILDDKGIEIDITDEEIEQDLFKPH